MTKIPFYSAYDNNGYDCDPADCNGAPKEFTETAQEFGATPDNEFTVAKDDIGGYTGPEIETSSERNAINTVKTASLRSATRTPQTTRSAAKVCSTAKTLRRTTKPPQR